MAGGDLVQVLSLDDYEYLTGMREAAGATDKLAEHVEHAGHSMHRSIHRAAHLAGSFAFMLSEGKGVEDMKGKFESLAMMAPMIGLAIGGWAGPLGIAAGIVGASLIPKILEGAEAWKSISEATKEAGKDLEAYIKREEALIDFKAKLGETKTQGELSKTVEEKERELEKMKGAAEAETKFIEMLQTKKEGLEKAKKGGAPGGLMDMLPGAALSKALGGPNVSDIINWGVGKMDIEPTLAEIDKQIKEHNEKRRGIGQGMIGIQQQLDFAGKAVPWQNNPLEKGVDAADKERAALIHQIREEVATPYEKASEKIRELNERRKEGLITDKQYEQGSKNVIKAFGASEGHQGVNAGVGRDSYSAIRESIRASEHVNDEKIKLLKQQVENGEKQQTELQNLNRNIEASLVQEVNIA